MFFPLSTIKKFHVEIVFVAWLRDLSWEVKIVYLLFQENTSRKFFIPLLLYLPVFWLQISSAFAIIFADCCGLSCLHLRASSYTALFRVFLRVVGPGSKKNLHAATRAPLFSPFSLIFFVFSSLHYHTCICVLFFFFLIPSTHSLRFGSRMWNANSDRNWNLFYHYLFKRTPVIYNFISQENVPLFSIYFH